MKRKKLLPSDIEQIDKLIPYRLSPADIEKFKTIIAGFEFILLGGRLICPTCGQLQEIQAQTALDGEIYFFLKFRCEDYPQNDLPKLPDTTQTQ